MLATIHISGFAVVYFALGWLATLGMIMIVFPLWATIGFLIDIAGVSIDAIARASGYERT